MKKIGFVMALLMVMCCGAVQAQDTVYMKNGSIIKGNVIEYIPDSTTKIKTKDGSMFVYETSEIERINKDESKVSLWKITSQWRQRGYHGYLDYSIGFVNKAGLSHTVTTTHGYRFNSWFFLGGGVGYNTDKFVQTQRITHINYKPDGTRDYTYTYYDEICYDFYIPVYVDCRFDFLKSRISPYIDQRLGVAAAQSTGCYIRTTVGCDFSIKPKAHLCLGLSYEGRTGANEDLCATIGFNW